MSFFEETKRHRTEQVGGDELVKVYLRVDNFRHQYIHEAYDLLTYLGDLGGILDVVLVVGMIVSGTFTSRVFQAAIVNSTYKI